MSNGEYDAEPRQQPMPQKYTSEVILVGNRLRDLREDADLNQTQLAQIPGMSQTGYSKYKTGENDIPTQVLIKLANYYKTSIDYILGVSNDRFPYQT